MMTLKEFLNATSDTPETELRRAITAALGVEPARTPEAYRRFYDRVLQELGASGDDEQEAVPVAVFR